MKTPHGYIEIAAEFGNPTTPADTANPGKPGKLSQAWKTANIKTIAPPPGWQLYDQPTGKKIAGLDMHIKLADSFRAVLTEIWEYAKAQLPPQATDDDVRAWLHKFRLDQTAGCFNYRASSGNGKVLSLHSWGIAIDWDPDHNPHQAPLKHTLPDWWYAIWTKHGWSNGTHFKTPDPMHVQFATGA